MSITNEALIEHLIMGQDLDSGMVRTLFERILEGSMPPAQIAASLVLLRTKQENAIEISVAAQIILNKANHIPRPQFLFADVVGTGGDGHDTINVSTLASFTAASIGLPVAKHGSSSASSKCGSADLLKEWGLNINLSPNQSRECLDEHGWCFLFAPLYHPTYMMVKSLRQELKIKTIFNILGPLVNPTAPPLMLIGVHHPQLLMPFASALRDLGRKRAMVVHGAGLDEIALHGPTQAIVIDDQNFEELVITPRDLGLASYPIDSIQVRSPQESAVVGEDILSGRADDAKTSMVAATTGVLLWLSQKAGDLRQGVSLAKDALRAGEPKKILDKVKRFGNGVK